MKKGILRIVFGSILLLLQVIGLWGKMRSGYEPYEPLLFDFYDFLLYIWGYFGVGICGTVLLFFGIRAYKTGEHAALILHFNTRKIHTVIRWVCVGFISLSFVYYVFLFVCNWQYGSIAIMLLQMFSLFFMLIYLLFYVGKRPSYVFSASLAFAGIVYLGRGADIFTGYSLYLFAGESGAPILWGQVLSYYMAGVLYLILAVKLYKEKFTGKWIRIFGWAAFIILIYGILLSDLLLWGEMYFNADALIIMLAPLVFFIYTCVLKVYGKSEQPEKEKFPAAPNKKMRADMGKTADSREMLFCRRCGKSVLEDSRFCSACGTEVIKLPKK